MNAKRNHRSKIALATLLTLSLLAAACAKENGADSSASGLQAGEQATLKVTYWDETSFYQNFGYLFMSKYPNIEFEIVSTSGIWEENDPGEAFIRLVKEQKPDVILTNPVHYEALHAEGLLYELDGMMEQDGFSTDGMLEGAVERLRWIGGGKLYGLAPTFTEEALYYNKDLFDKYGVPLPQDGMTWNDLLVLAEMFPKDGGADERVYGLQLYDGGTVSELFLRYGAQNGLRVIDASGEKVTLATEYWQQAADIAHRFGKSGAVYEYEGKPTETYADYIRQDLFISGRVAMRLMESNYIGQIEEARKVLGEEAVTNWDLATAPTNPDTPNRSSTFSLSEITAVHAQSAHAQAAWEFVKYVNSDEFAKITSRAPIWSGLPVRTAYIRNEEGKHMEAFYALSPKPESSNYLASLQLLPESFLTPFIEALDRHWKKLADGVASPEEALQALEAEAQALWDTTK